MARQPYGPRRDDAGRKRAESVGNPQMHPKYGHHFDATGKYLYTMYDHAPSPGTNHLVDCLYSFYRHLAWFTHFCGGKVPLELEPAIEETRRELLRDLWSEVMWQAGIDFATAQAARGSRDAKEKSDEHQNK